MTPQFPFLLNKIYLNGSLSMSTDTDSNIELVLRVYILITIRSDTERGKSQPQLNNPRAQGRDTWERAKKARREARAEAKETMLGSLSNAKKFLYHVTHSAQLNCDMMAVLQPPKEAFTQGKPLRPCTSGVTHAL